MTAPSKTKVSARYLGVEFDSKLTFWPQIKKSSDKAAATTVSLSRLMANVGGPKQCKRKLLMAVVESQLLYGAEIWASALNTAKYRKRITVVQRRGALRVACSYRTVSVLVIAGTIPIDLLAKERKRIYDTRPRAGKEQVAKKERKRTMEEWQRRWDQEKK
ncbi:hypothetical protein J437_LFUL003429 [Ladona fulva]|uniref:Reverse transcriptase domain-containing protein n=1 Tax=Ladona fulva TaxID=123851 RepID=A0A8K0NZJ1_LADFU|nr:hypothetical protein J437_LFUL003429 [Ladona fulva]